MEFQNLENNILYLMCSRFQPGKPGGESYGAIKKRTVFRKFSDIPAEDVELAIDRICHAGWMTQNDKRTILHLTGPGSEKIGPLCRPRGRMARFL